MKFTLADSGAFESQFEFGSLSISGNSDLGYRPFQLMTASIAGCSGGVFRKILEKKRISFTNIEITASVERNPEEANKITKMNLHFIVEGKNLNLQQLQKSLDVANKNCAMAQSIKGSFQLIETVEIREGNDLA